MLTLTLTQPYATLVAIGAKQIETRSWYSSVRDDILIHAATTYAGVGGKNAFIELCTSNEYIYKALNDAGLVPFEWDPEALLALPTGAILCKRTMVDCYRTALFVSAEQQARRVSRMDDPSHIPLSDQERAMGDYSHGRYGFILKGTDRFATPIPARGKLGFWTYEGLLPTEVIHASQPV